MKNFKGKAIYNPSGKAGEYAEWACNFYVGCSNDCSYCYCKKGVLAHAMGGLIPTLKKCFKDESDAFEVFQKELKANISELQKSGLFFTFTSDPMLPETRELTKLAINECLWNDIPVKILTKCADHVSQFIYEMRCTDYNLGMIAFGFTLTGHDELEPGASTNAERIEAMKKLHDAGFKTFASIEPIVDLESSFNMIMFSRGYCDLYKIGLMSGQKVDRGFYARLRSFNLQVVNALAHFPAKVYWKESFTKQFSQFPAAGCNVNRDYNIFNHKNN